MKSNRSFLLTATIALIVIGLVLASPAAAQRRGSSQNSGACVGGVGALFDEIEMVELTVDEEDDLLFMWEEEKLARDVYLSLTEAWQLPIFANIAHAEQKHMELMFKLIETYNFAARVPDDVFGVFVDAELGALFDQFVADGNSSLVDALRVGATIEDKDLADLYNLIEYGTENKQVELVAYNLAKGSRNHLRAFVRALGAQGETYAPLFLESDTYEAILETGTEQQMFYNADGEPVAACGAAVGGFGMQRGQVRRGGQVNGTDRGSNGDGSGDCDGAGPHGGGHGSGNGGGS